MAIDNVLLTTTARFDETRNYDVLVSLFDVDNTLVPNESDSLPSPAFRYTAEEASPFAELGLITARQLEKASRIIRQTRLRGLSILSNGAQIFDGANEVMVDEQILSPGATGQIASFLQNFNIGHWIQDNGTDHFWLGSQATTEATQEHRGLGDYVRADNIWQRPTEGNQRFVAGYQPLKPFVVVADRVSDENLPELLEFGDSLGSNVAAFVAHENNDENGRTSQVFFQKPTATKEAALLRLADMTEIEIEHIMVTGDGPNDAGVVALAGIGVAVANAVPKTLEAATFIAPRWDQDGAAIALRELVIH